MSVVGELTEQPGTPSITTLPPLRIRVDKTAKAGEPLRGRQCNLACAWCHGDFFDRRLDVPAISNAEILQAVSLTIAASARPEVEIKISGQGEPCLAGAEELCDLIAGLQSLPRVSAVKLITNGTLLEGMVEDLAASGLDAATVTINSLDPQVYARITRRDSLGRAIRGVEAALRAGLTTKLNVVYCRLNEGEAWDFVRFSGQHGGMVVRFVDLLITNRECSNLYLPLRRLHDELMPLATSQRVLFMPYRAREYRFGTGAVVQIKTAGRINECPNTHCAYRARCLEGCRSSVRISQDGTLHPCGVRTDNVITLVNSRATVGQVREALLSGGKDDRQRRPRHDPEPEGEGLAVPAAEPGFRPGEHHPDW